MISGKVVVFATAWRENAVLTQNLRNMANLTETLVAHNMPFQTVLGRYNSADEQALAIALHGRDMVAQVCRHVGVVYQQECIGLLDLHDMSFGLMYPGGRYELVGKFTAVTEAEAFRAEASTYWQGQWWVAQ